MEDKDLLRLANIAIVRQHINHIINSNVDRKNVNPIQKIGRELDEQFVKLLMVTPEDKTVLNSITIESTTFEDKPAFVKYGKEEADEVKQPSSERPKIKTSKKAAK